VAQGRLLNKLRSTLRSLEVPFNNYYRENTMLTPREQQIVDLAVTTAIDKVKNDEALLKQWLEEIKVPYKPMKIKDNPAL
jgi:hypothetical protein